MIFPPARLLARAYLALLTTAVTLLPGTDAHAFGCAQAPDQYTCTAIDVPGSFSTRVNGINNAGVLSGYYETPGVGTFRKPVAGGFDLPGNGAGAAAAYGFGLNDAGHIVGYTLGAGGYQGFVWDGNTYSSHAFGSNIPTFAFGINNAGTVVGAYQTSPSTASGYVLSGSTYQSVNVGGARSTYVYGINNGGTLAGTYISATGEIVGFKGSASAQTDVRVPGARQTYVRGINNIGDVVGSYVDAAGLTKGFAQLTDGSFWTFAVSDALRTNVMGINDNRAVAGFYALDEYFSHGFVAELKPLPIPPAAAMLAAGLVMLGTRLRRRAPAAV